MGFRNKDIFSLLLICGTYLSRPSNFDANELICPLLGVFLCLLAYDIRQAAPVMSKIAVKPFSEHETNRLKRAYRESFDKRGLRYLRTQPGNCVLPTAYERFKAHFATFNLREDDVYIRTFPKNGTTWIAELVWNVMNNVDLDDAKAVSLLKRVPFIESPVLQDAVDDALQPSDIHEIKLMETMPSPRILKTHLPLCLLPTGLLNECKVVSCLRNPKDSIVSFYHHEKLFVSHGYTGDFATYFDLFMDDMILYSPYFNYIVDMWEKRHHPNMCILFFEDMKEDLAGTINKVSRFLERDLTKEQTLQLVDHLSFRKMKNNNAVNFSQHREIVSEKTNAEVRCFMRKGQVGDWKNYFTPEMNKRMDEAIDKHFTSIGLHFRYE